MKPFIDYSDVTKTHKDVLQTLADSIKKRLTEAGEATVKDLAATTAFGGTKAKKSLRSKLISKRTLRVWSRRPSLFYQEEGTKPHIIRPRRKRFLKFYHARFGATVFARKVKHPGNRAHWIVRDAFNTHAEEALNKLLTDLST